jgi:hypothetical protein
MSRNPFQQSLQNTLDTVSPAAGILFLAVGTVFEEGAVCGDGVVSGEGIVFKEHIVFDRVAGIALTEGDAY